MGRKLAFGVLLPGEDGQPVLYRADTEPPPDIAGRITNEAAWQPRDPDEEEPTPPAEPPKRSRGRKGKSEQSPDAAPAVPDASTGGGAAAALGQGPAGDGGEEHDAGSGGDHDGDGATAPAGNAATEKWRAYAELVGVAVPDDAGREDIKALLVDKGLLEA